MSQIRPKSGFSSLRAPLRRVIAIDAGSRRIRLLLAQNNFGKLRILRQELLDLKAEGLVAPDEIKNHVLRVLETWGHPPLALALPEQVSISQRMELPQAPEAEVDQLIANETIKLGGVSDSKIIYDFVQLEPARNGKQQFWVSLCQEGEIRNRTKRLGIDQDIICEITTTGNALAAAFLAARPSTKNAILLHIGAQSTVILAILAGQIAAVASFPMGGDFFTRSLLRLRQGSEEAAERLKHTTNLLGGPNASAEFTATVEAWADELARQLQEWARENPELGGELAGHDYFVHGATFRQPGFKEFLAGKGFKLHDWPEGSSTDLELPDGDFEIAFGTALLALGHAGPHPSLLPSDYRRGWQKRLTRQRIEVASLVLAVFCFVVLIAGTWLKISMISQKKEFLSKLVAAQQMMDANQSLSAELIAEYESLRPLLVRQQNTIDLLKTLSLLDKPRTNQNFWFVLITDQDSYFSHPPALLSTNRPARTNLLGPALAPPGFVADSQRASTASTNLAIAKPGVIAELCISGNPDSTRHLLSELVNDLKHEPLFSKVDLLSEDLRRNLADPKVVLSDRYFAISLDYAEVELHQPVLNKRPLARLKGVAPRSNRLPSNASAQSPSLSRPLL